MKLGMGRSSLNLSIGSALEIFIGVFDFRHQVSSYSHLDQQPYYVVNQARLGTPPSQVNLSPMGRWAAASSGTWACAQTRLIYHIRNSLWDENMNRTQCDSLHMLCCL
jgi:hypothetical protein